MNSDFFCHILFFAYCIVGKYAISDAKQCFSLMLIRVHTGLLKRLRYRSPVYESPQHPTSNAQTRLISCSLNPDWFQKVCICESVAFKIILPSSLSVYLKYCASLIACTLLSLLLSWRIWTPTACSTLIHRLKGLRFTRQQSIPHILKGFHNHFHAGRWWWHPFLFLFFINHLHSR